jgi:hypothetical protein
VENNEHSRAGLFTKKNTCIKKNTCKNRVLHKKANGNKMWKTMNAVGQAFSQRKIHA